MLNRNRQKEDLYISISNRTIVRVILFGVATYAGFRFFNNIRHPLTLIFMSFFLAMALNPIVNYITRRLKSKSRVRGTAVAYLLVVTLLVSFFSIVVPPIIRQSTDFIQTVPSTITNLETQDSSMGRLVRKYRLDTQLNRVASDWANNLGSAQGPVFTTAKSILVTIVSLISIFVLTFMMLVEGPDWVKLFIKHLPPARREHTGYLLHRMYELVTRFVNAQVVVALIAGTFSLITMSIAGRIYHVNINPVALAGIVTVFGIIPTIGNIMAAVTVSLICLFTSAPLAITMLIYFIVYQQVENVTVQPYIQSRNNDLTPMLVFIAALLGIGFGGLLGGFVAIPAAGCVKILIEDYLDDHKVNGSTTSKVASEQ